MDVGFAAGVATPGEGAMSKGNFQAETIEKKRPELCNLFALCDGIRRDKTDASFTALNIFARLEKPCGDVVEGAARTSEAGDATNLCTLEFALIFSPRERRGSLSNKDINCREGGAPGHFQDPSVVDLLRLFL